MGDFRPESYFRPKTPVAASRLLAKYGRSSMIIGGGTEIYELGQRGLLSGIRALVDITNLSLNRVKIERRHAAVGASVTLAELERSKSLYSGNGLGCLRDSLAEIRPLQVKNLATVGGAICSCIPFFDLPVALAALEAVVDISGPGRTRSLSVVDFQRDFLQPNLHKGEFVKGIRIHRQNISRPSAFSKFSETGDDWAIVNCGCSLALDGDTIEQATIAFGAISNKPFIARETAKALAGQRASPGLLSRAEQALEKELPEPNSDHRASSAYRRKLARVLLGSTFERALSRKRAGA